MVTTPAYLITRLARAAAGGTRHSPVRNGIDIAVLALLVIPAAAALRPRNRSDPPSWMGKLRNASAPLSFTLGFLRLGVLPSDILMPITVGRRWPAPALAGTAGLAGALTPPPAAGLQPAPYRPPAAGPPLREDRRRPGGYRPTGRASSVNASSSSTAAASTAASSSAADPAGRIPVTGLSRSSTRGPVFSAMVCR